MNTFFSLWKAQNAKWKAELLAEYFTEKETVLDFGCGDLSVSRELKNLRKLSITGVDVIESKNRPTNIKFVKYSGDALPFHTSSFDTVIAFYVFHHCNDARAAFGECLRVARQRVIFVESVYRWRGEVPCMRFMDWLYNVVKYEHIPLPYTFLSLRQWKETSQKQGSTITSIRLLPQLFLPSWVPVGVTQVIEVQKRSKLLLK